jgi:hypothetical protein
VVRRVPAVVPLARPLLGRRRHAGGVGGR